MLRQSNPDCLCIVETKISTASCVLEKLGFPDSVEIPAEGLRGGMIFAWRRGFDFDVLVTKQNLLSIIVYGDIQPWALSFIQSSCEASGKELFWEDLERVESSFGGPWLIMGILM